MGAESERSCRIEVENPTVAASVVLSSAETAGGVSVGVADGCREVVRLSMGMILVLPLSAKQHNLYDYMLV